MLRFRLEVGCCFREAITFYVGVWKHVKRSGYDVAVVETIGQRTVSNLSVIVYLVDSFGAFVFTIVWYDLTISIVEVHAQVPFADTCGRVAFALQDSGHGIAVWVDERTIDSPKNAAFQTRTPTVPARHYAIASRGANSGRGVRIRESHSFSSDPIHSRCGDLRIWIVSVHVAKAQIVC